MQADAGKRAKSLMEGTHHLGVLGEDAPAQMEEGGEGGPELSIKESKTLAREQQQLKSKQTQLQKKKESFMRLVQHCRLELLKKRDAGEDTKAMTKVLVDAENLVCRCKVQTLQNKEEATEWMGSLDTRMAMLKETWNLQPVNAKAKAAPKTDVVESAAAGAVAEPTAVEGGDAVDPAAASAADAEVEAADAEVEADGPAKPPDLAGSETGVSPPVTTKRLGAALRDAAKKRLKKSD
eukprot:2308911-Amphidinium_carterae.1